MVEQIKRTARRITLRIFKKPNGGVIINCPGSRFQPDQVDQCPLDIDCDGLEYASVDADIFFQHGTDYEYHEQLYCDGPCAVGNFRVDTQWTCQVMPTFLVKKKHLHTLNARLDALLAENVPDVMEVVRLQRERETCKAWSDAQWHEQALKNLDARVAGGEPDKPAIRKKLQQQLGKEPK